MARYEYKCEACNVLKEVSKPMSQSDIPEMCTTCSAQMVKQFAQTAPPQFVGGSRATVSMKVRPKGA